MTTLQLALKRYAQRSQFHDQPLLDAVIKAVREEERKNFEKLIAAAQDIVGGLKREE